MGRTGGFWEQDLAFPDGQIFISPADAMAPTIAGASINRGNIGQYSINFTGAGGTFIGFPINNVIFRYGKQDDAQQQFGMANPVGGFQGAQSQPTPPAQFTTPWGPGRPPQKSTLFGQPILSRPKGIALLSIAPVYRVSGAGVFSATVGITGTSWLDNQLPLVNQILAPTTFPTPLTGIPLMPTIPIPQPNQIMLTDYNTEYIIELSLSVNSGGTLSFNGFFLNIAYNYN